MSETVHYKGIARAIEIPNGKTVNDVASDILENLDFLMADYYKDELECLTDSFDDDYFYHKKKGILYKITKNAHDLEDEIIKAELRSDGVIEYELRYYNGGAGFDECLGEAMDKM